MVSLAGFNAANIAPDNPDERNQDYSPIPKGNYTAIIEDIEERVSTTSGIAYLNVTIEIIEGEFTGRKLWDKLFLWHDGKAKDIANARLSAICHAVGVLAPQDTAELTGKALIVATYLKRDKKSGEQKNEVAGYKAVSGGAGPSSVPKPAGAPAPKTSKAPSAMPWA